MANENMPELMLSYMRQKNALNDRMNEGYLETASLGDCQENLEKAKILIERFREHSKRVLENLLDESARQSLVEANDKTMEKYIGIKNKLESRVLELQVLAGAISKKFQGQESGDKAEETKEEIVGNTQDLSKTQEKVVAAEADEKETWDRERLKLELQRVQLRLEESHRLLFNSPYGEDPDPREKAFINSMRQEPVHHSIASSITSEERALFGKMGVGAPAKAVPARFPDIQLKLDKIQLPTFSGDYLEWLAFRDQFRDLIHKNPKLDEMVKFHQLRTHLKGSAYEVIRGYAFTAVNYSHAWDDLNRRFNREDAIIEEYIRRFVDIQKLREDGGVAQYSSMMDITRQMLQALPNFSINVEAWGPMMKYILISKFDAETKKEWRMHIGKEQQVPLEELLDFLDVLTFRLHDGEKRGKGRHQHANQSRFRAVNMTTAEIKQEDALEKIQKQINQISARPSTEGAQVETGCKPCGECNGPHPLYSCQVLKGLSAADRSQKMREWDLCFKCLGSHARGECKFGNCPECQMPHNTFLCYKIERRNKQKRRERGQAVNHA